MRIGSDIRQGTGRASAAGVKITDLKKSDLIADIFNNQPPDDKEEKSDVKLHLSNAARVLTEEYKQTVTRFLADNKQLAKDLQSIVLPDESIEQNPSLDLTVRKLGAYVKWLSIKEKVGLKSSESSSTPYEAVHRQGKDVEIKSLIKELEGRRQLANQQRRKNLPNYYYMVYPETYSFN